MIVRITKKQYKRIKSLQKLSFARTGIVFIGHDGMAYVSSEQGMGAAKEIFDFKREQKKHLTTQPKLID